MSFGFSVSDFIQLGTLAKELHHACKSAGPDYQELETLCTNVSIAVSACRLSDPFTVMRHQDAAAVTVLITACESTLNRLRALLGKYSSFNGAKGFALRIRFVSASDERQSIKEALRDHLNTLQTFLHGSQVDLTSLIVRLLLRNISDEKRKDGTGLDVSLIPNSDSLIDDFLGKLVSQDGEAKKELEGMNSGIKAKLKEYESSKEPPALNSKDDTSNLAKVGPSPGLQRRNRRYDPWLNSWFINVGYRYLWPVSTLYANHVHTPFVDELPRYTEMDDWLCILPEGWSINFTLSERGAGEEQAFQYVFNNLSCSKDNSLESSRPYFLAFSFTAENFLIKLLPNPSSPVRFEWNMPNAFLLPLFAASFPAQFYNAPYQMSTNQWDIIPLKPPYQRWPGTQCTGFVTDKGWPIDLSDQLSFQLATTEIGQIDHPGQRSQYTDEEIDNSLPENWVWTRDSSGQGRHVYYNTMDETESTVHPARFYREGDETLTALPPGWDRRLDKLGNLFFVDHHTKNSMREDPRFNPRIDQQTGLPKGWHGIQDKTNTPFFYTEIGKRVIGTWHPWTMRTKAMDKKRFIPRVPKEKEYLKKIWAGIDSTEESEPEAPPPPTPVSIPEPQPQILESLPNITTEEENAYSQHFAAAIKHYAPHEHKIPQKLAYRYCFKHLNIPTNISKPAILWADTNKDEALNPKEFARALHMMHHMLLKHWEALGSSTPSVAQSREYEQVFAAAKAPGNYVAMLEEVVAASKHWDLADAVVREIWGACTESEDKEGVRWTVDEFGVGWHRGEEKAQRWRVLKGLVNPPDSEDKEDVEGEDLLTLDQVAEMEEGLSDVPVLKDGAVPVVTAPKESTPVVTESIGAT